MNGDFVSSGMRLVGFELLVLDDATRVPENPVNNGALGSHVRRATE